MTSLAKTRHSRPVICRLTADFLTYSHLPNIMGNSSSKKVGTFSQLLALLFAHLVLETAI